MPLLLIFRSFVKLLHFKVFEIYSIYIISIHFKFLDLVKPSEPVIHGNTGNIGFFSCLHKHLPLRGDVESALDSSVPERAIRGAFCSNLLTHRVPIYRTVNIQTEDYL